MNFKDTLDVEWIVDKAYVEGDVMVIHVHDKYGHTDKLRVDVSNLISPCTNVEREIYEALQRVLFS